MKVGLFFGSFNPVHIGHMALANYFVEFTDLQELWFVVSPHNPLKEKESLLADHFRFEMVELAIRDDRRFRVCDVEFKMPKPSFTIDTLAYLSEKYRLIVLYS
jgi:nicotinate-nucleotide adenylyltransferase